MISTLSLERDEAFASYLMVSMGDGKDQDAEQNQKRKDHLFWICAGQ